MKKERFVLGLTEVGLDDIGIAGGKNASLGEMINNLSGLGIRIPDGFIITVDAFRLFVEVNQLGEKIQELVKGIDFNSVESLRRGGLQIRQLIRNARFPSELSTVIIDEYRNLSAKFNQEITDVAVRSSATAEDLPDASFAGQQETYLNVRGPAALMDAVRNCFASLFTDRAISYREGLGYDHFSIGLSVCVQKMVRSDLGISGVAFSLDTESGFKDVVLINASYGLGEMLVQGSVSPDEYMVFKPLVGDQFRPIIEKKLGAKDKMMIYGDDPDERVKIIPTDRLAQQRFCLSDENVLRLAEWVTKIESYYSKRKGAWCPMDVEWAIDGLSQELYILQARPETVHSRKPRHSISQLVMDKNQSFEVLLKGIAVGDKIGSGKVNIMYSLDKRTADAHEFQTGDILVTDMTDPDWEPIMKKAAAIITNKGGRTCHAAIVAREMGVPAIVGCGNATDILQNGQEITVSCAEGDQGLVYKGLLSYSTLDINLDELPDISTSLMFNVGSPAIAFNYTNLPNKGVGLAREEFIINTYIQVHPLALLNHQSLGDAELSEAIGKLTRGYDNEQDYFISKLSYGIGRIAAAYYPSKVIVRFSDFKSNEYYNLLGGKYFEPNEENPMIGWRGASRYYSPEFKNAFALECRAIRKVREEMGLKNVVVMVPFCRTVDELIKVKKVMREYGLIRGQNGLEVYLMAELPSNIILAEKFADYVDGFSIGSNDLTQLVLGLDRDSSLVAHLYDERNEAVKEMISSLILVARQAKVKVGICGQGPSDFPDFTQFLVEQGIDSISVTPDSAIKTIYAIAEVEARLLKIAT